MLLVLFSSIPPSYFDEYIYITSATQLVVLSTQIEYVVLEENIIKKV